MGRGCVDSPAFACAKRQLMRDHLCFFRKMRDHLVWRMYKKRMALEPCVVVGLRVTYLYLNGYNHISTTLEGDYNIQGRRGTHVPITILSHNPLAVFGANQSI
jgi:hypothetical protein